MLSRYLNCLNNLASSTLLNVTKQDLTIKWVISISLPIPYFVQNTKI